MAAFKAFILLAVALQCAQAAWSSSGTAAPEKELARNLLKTAVELGVAGRPVKNPTEVVKVSTSLALQNVIKMEKNSITIATTLRLSWSDPFLSWTPSQFGGLESIVLPASAIWKPDLVNWNDIHHKLADQQAGMDVANVVVRSDGRVTWQPRANYAAVCSYRFDEENDDDLLVCPFVFGSWSYDSKQVDVEFANPSNADFSMEAFQPSALVEVVEHSAEKSLVNAYAEEESTAEKKYAVLTYELTVRKAPKDAFYTMASSSSSASACSSKNGKCHKSSKSNKTA